MRCSYDQGSATVIGFFYSAVLLTTNCVYTPGRKILTAPLSPLLSGMTGISCLIGQELYRAGQKIYCAQTLGPAIPR